MKVLSQIQEREAALTQRLPADFEQTDLDSVEDPAMISGAAQALGWVLKLFDKPKIYVLTDDQMRAMQAALDNDKNAWAELHGKTRSCLIKKNLVTMVGLYPKLTDTGNSVALAKEMVRSATATEIPEDATSESTGEKLAFTEDQMTALQAAVDHNRDVWSTLHGRTIGSITKHNWVVMFDTYPALTPAGEQIAEQFKIDKTDSHVDIPEECRQTPIVLVKRVNWSPNQIACFKIVATKDKTRWDSLSMKTRSVMIDSGWVSVAEDGTPFYTDSGRTMAVMNGVSVHSLASD